MKREQEVRARSCAVRRERLSDMANQTGTQVAKRNDQERDFFCTVRDAFRCFAQRASVVLGSAWAFCGAVLVIVVWLVTGPTFHFSDTWQLIINTATTVITFLMVFLIQRAQNKDALAIHLKLNEIVAAMEGASNRLIDVEDLSEPEIDALRAYYKRLIELARQDDVLTATHSIEEAATRHGFKYKKKPPKNSKNATKP